MNRVMTRRSVLAGVTAGAIGLIGLDALRGHSLSGRFLEASEGLTLRMQRLLLSPRTLVREFSLASVSKFFPVNGTRLPAGDGYQRMVEANFANWALRVDGLVRRPLVLSLAELRGLGSRTQVTMHNCDEGWNAIGQWKGVPLGSLLTLAGLAPSARYVVFHCLDQREENGERYYESIDLFDAYHPQTILAYEMNGRPLPVEYGAPLRLRVETQIGYKNAKYLERIEVVSRLDNLGRGRGGWWEDFDNAVWYAGQ